MCRADLGDPDMQYRILHSASKRLQQGGPKRICVTTPPLVISATLLAQQYYQMKDQARIIKLLSLLIPSRHSNALISLVLFHLLDMYQHRRWNFPLNGLLLLHAITDPWNESSQEKYGYE